MRFVVYRSRYSAEQSRLHFSASGERDGVRFSVVTDVKCTKDPISPENTHLVALVRIEELFRQRSASGR
jgi:hypothetical protein